MLTESYVRCFDGIRLTDIPEVGGKNASLGELHAMLAAKAGRVPDGFGLIANAHREALATDDVEKKLRRLLAAGGGRVPDGFALIADAYREALTAAGAWGSCAIS